MLLYLRFNRRPAPRSQQSSSPSTWLRGESKLYFEAVYDVKVVNLNKHNIMNDKRTLSCWKNYATVLFCVSKILVHYYEKINPQAREN